MFIGFTAERQKISRTEGEERASLAGFTGVGLRVVGIGHLALLNEHRGQHDF